MLKGKVALVTGASRGIGFSIARALAWEGVRVGLFARDPQRLAEVEQELKAAGPKGGEGLSLPGDVTRPEDAERAVERLEATFGGLDYLINNAGVGIFKPVQDLSPQEWRQVLETNLSGVFYMTRAAIPALLRRGGGIIINIGSLAGKTPSPGEPPTTPASSAWSAFLKRSCRICATTASG